MVRKSCPFARSVGLVGAGGGAVSAGGGGGGRRGGAVSAGGAGAAAVWPGFFLDAWSVWRYDVIAGAAVPPTAVTPRSAAPLLASAMSTPTSAPTAPAGSLTIPMNRVFFVEATCTFANAFGFAMWRTT